jgi:predicted dehydrogenase
MNSLRFGILGLGAIAHKFALDLRLVKGANLIAAASRTDEKAENFAREHGVNHYYGRYEDLLADPAVDIVYIATPHDSHEKWTLAAIEAGKHVLCEKPMGVNRTQVECMVHAARERGVFLMEALWSRFNPTIMEVLGLLRDKAIGEVNYLNADFCFHYEKDDIGSRLLDARLAGGALLDVGIYPLFLAYSIFGKPSEIAALSRFDLRTGIDAQTAMILTFDSGIASLMSGFISKSDMTGRIYGTAGQIYIDSRWHESQGYTLVAGGKTEYVSLPKLGKGYTYEIEECIRCIAEGRLESPLWSHQNSLDLAEIMDEVREKVGLKYPFEE